MNDRIKELIKRATSYTWNGDGVTEELDPELLVKLVVKECFDAVIADGRFHDAKSVVRAAKSVAMDHFGVSSDVQG